jgi:tetratricopeptide (TPR) repeat protein
VAGFFDEPWRRPVAELTESDRNWLLSSAGFRLQALGRLSEAAEPIEASLGAAIQLGRWDNAVIAADNLSGLYLTLGEVGRAVEYAEQGVEFADRSEEMFQDITTSRASLANALHQAGRVDESEVLFREAESIQQEDPPQCQYLYSLGGYEYCDLLLGQGKYQEVIERAKKFFEWRVPSDSLLDIALDNLSLGRAYLLALGREGTVDYADAATYLDRAVAGLRRAGQQDLLPSGLLARAALYRVRGEFERAEQDLQEVMDLAVRCGMRLHETDAHLEYARLYLAADQSKKQGGTREDGSAMAREHLDKAEQLIADTGYHRRDADLADLKASS